MRDILLWSKPYPRPVLKLRLLQLYVPLHEDTSGSVLRNNMYILIHF